MSQSAVDDLNRCVSQANEVVARLTDEACILELVPIKNTETAYKLQFRKIDSESPPSDLGVYNITTTGYPIERWYSLMNWEKNELITTYFDTVSAVESHFNWLASSPSSRLMLLIRWYKENHET